jgi:hypothetical protein
MDTDNDIQLHALETIEENLSVDRSTEAEGTDGLMVYSASGLMVYSAAGLMVYSASGLMVY